jgi:hypothetical protein
MHQLTWQKSSYSVGEGNNCLNLAACPDGTLRLRESDEPEVVLTAGPAGLGALIRRVKAGGFDRPGDPA